MLQTPTLVTEWSVKLHLVFKMMTALTEFKTQRKLKNGFGYSFLNILTLFVIHFEEL